MMSRDRREEERQYHGDVEYEVWRSGGNPDLVDYDRVQDRFYDGQYPEQTASEELRRQRERHQCEEQDQQEEG